MDVGLCATSACCGGVILWNLKADLNCAQALTVLLFFFLSLLFALWPYVFKGRGKEFLKWGLSTFINGIMMSKCSENLYAIGNTEGVSAEVIKKMFVATITETFRKMVWKYGQHLSYFCSLTVIVVQESLSFPDGIPSQASLSSMWSRRCGSLLLGWISAWAVHWW